jgi:hypothetical protein
MLSLTLMVLLALTYFLRDWRLVSVSHVILCVGAEHHGLWW